MHFLSSYLGVLGLYLLGDEYFFHGLYHVQTFLGSWGVYDFPVGICFARCYRRFQSSLFCTRAMTFWIFTMSSVFLFLSLDDLAQLLHFFHHHLFLDIVPFFSAMFWTWRNFSHPVFFLIDIFHATKEVESEQESIRLFFFMAGI